MNREMTAEMTKKLGEKFVIDFGLFQTANEKMKKVLEIATGIASTPAPVLISGEQGVGKNLLVKLILEKSRFQKKLHRWGAFSRFSAETSHDLAGLQSGDAVVIEDLNRLSLSQQSDINEYIDEAKAQEMQIRWFATSSVRPEDLARLGQLSKSLFYRLSVIHLDIPSLRERDGDIEILAHFFVQVFSLMKSQTPKVLSAEAKMKLLSYNWPGNVAELENVIERAVSLSENSEIAADQIQFAELEEQALRSEGTTLSDMEKKLILQTLQITQQNKTRAAQMLGISIRTLRNKLNEYRVSSAAPNLGELR